MDDDHSLKLGCLGIGTRAPVASHGSGAHSYSGSEMGIAVDCRRVPGPPFAMRFPPSFHRFPLVHPAHDKEIGQTAGEGCNRVCLSPAIPCRDRS